MKAKNPILEYTTLFIVIIVSVLVFLQIKNQDVNLCRSVFSNLVKGKYAAEKFIDWENFKALNLDVGATYTGLVNNKERLDYKKEFIRYFSAGFSNARGKLNLFTHWRIYERSDDKVIVAADYPSYNKTLLFTISKLGKRKLTALYWR